LVVARTRHFAGLIQPQFARGQVEKVYLVKVQGTPSADEFSCDAPISAESGVAGSRFVDEEAGLAASTRFKVVERFGDDTALIEASPLTGRTNQIRVHLWHLGIPVFGDPVYLSAHRLGDTQTLDIDSPPLCLHAWKITFRHPVSKQRMTFTAPPPAWANASAIRSPRS
jgi:23S rRNA-/tRNA-specific pseudouridylate synthase